MGNIEYAYAIEELQSLIGKYFSKFRQAGDNVFILTIGDTSIAIELGIRLHATKYLLEGEQEGGFAATVRNLLKNQRLSALYQYKNDRIAVFQFDSKLLIFEMFAKGNAVVVEDNTTLAVFRGEQWSDRIIKNKEKYGFPKSNLKTSLREALSDRFVISALLSLPLGKEYAKEMLYRCGIPEKKPGKELSDDEIHCIQNGIDSISSLITPCVFYSDGRVSDYGLIRFNQYDEAGSKRFPTFNEALDFFYWNVEKKENDDVAKIRSRVEMQKKALERLKDEEKKAQEGGDYIYAHYEQIQNILSLANKYKLEELEEGLKKHNPKVNKKEKEIEIEL